MRYSAGVRPARGRNMAIAEWPTTSGPADYALFVGTVLIGVVEAKRRRKTCLPPSIKLSDTPTASPRRPMLRLRGPMGAPSAIRLRSQWSILPEADRDRERHLVPRHATPRQSPPRPYRLADAQGLSGQLEIDQDAATASLKVQLFDFGFPLRPYQRDAIVAVELALAKDQRRMLIAMATGTGKTKLAIALLYRLLAAKVFAASASW